MKIYCVTFTQYVTAHVVAESREAAVALALRDGDEWMSDGLPESDAEAVPADAGSWEPGELPYLTDGSKDVEELLMGGGDHDCDAWDRAIAAMEPAVDARTVPLPLRYEDGHVERVASVPQGVSHG